MCVFTFYSYPIYYSYFLSALVIKSQRLISKETEFLICSYCTFKFPIIPQNRLRQLFTPPHANQGNPG